MRVRVVGLRGKLGEILAEGLTLGSDVAKKIGIENERLDWNRYALFLKGFKMSDDIKDMTEDELDAEEERLFNLILYCVEDDELAVLISRLKVVRDLLGVWDK